MRVPRGSGSTPRCRRGGDVVSRTAVVSVAQLAWSEPSAAQRERTATVAGAALRDGSDIVVLPELAVPGYTTDRKRLEHFAEPLDGPTVRAWREVAAAGHGYVIGGFCERADDQLFNTAVVVSGNGVILHYRKTHLFGEERGVLAGGDLGFPIVATSVGVLGICVCYDLRFVEVARLLALQGADLVCVPAAWVTGYDRPGRADARWPDQVTGLLMQANLNQVFVAAASFAGSSGRFLGNSVVADPYGDPLVGPLARDRDDVATTMVDLEVAKTAQHRSALIRPREDRRRDLYRIEYRGHRY